MLLSRERYIRPLHDILDNHIILHHITDENTDTDVCVDTTAFVGYRGPQTAPFASDEPAKGSQ